MAAPALDLHVASKSGGNSTLRLTGDEGTYTFGGGYNVDNADPAVIMIPDQMVSRVHCSLSWSEDIGWMLADLAGTNGTFVNGHLITAPVLLQSGGTFRIGGSVVRVEYDTSSQSEEDETILLQDRSADGTDDDATVLLEGDKTTVIASGVGGQSGILVGPLDNENVVASSDDERTLVLEDPSFSEGRACGRSTIQNSAGGTDDDATVVVGGDGSPVVFEGDKTTVIASGVGGQSGILVEPLDNENVVASTDDEQTLVQGEPGFGEGRARGGSKITCGADEVQELSEYPVSPQIPIDTTDLGTLRQGRRSTSDPVPLTPEFPTPSRDDSAVAGFEESGLIGKLIGAQLVNPEQAQQYISRARNSGQTFFSEMVNDRTGDENREVYQWVSSQYHFDLVEDGKVLQKMLSEPVEWLPPSVAERRKALILNGDGDGDGNVKYGTTDPFDIVTRDWIERRTGKKAGIVAVPPAVFREIIGRLRRGADDDEKGDLSYVPIVFSSEEEEEFETDLHFQEVPRIVEYLMYQAYVQRASDIHVEPTETGLLVRNRVDGMLHDECQMPPDIRRAVTSRIKILANMDVAEKRRPQDGRISVIINDAPIDIRVSSYPTVHGEKIVMRLLDRSLLSPRPDDLGLIDKDLRKLIDKINAPLGLILLCGPTGSGKTTTLYSCLGSIDRRTKNVLTVEDPVEYRLEGVHQMQVNEKIGLTFAAGLRTILRQDPDVVMIGECRDEETANMAIQASLTGHVVFSTIHANDSIGVVTRLLDMNIDPFLVSSAITVAIAQRLLRTVCRNCSTGSVTGDVVLRRLREDGISDEKLEHMGIEIDADLEYVNPTGCDSCRGSGYSGRRPVFEVFEMTNECRRMVMSANFDPAELKRIAQRNGMTTLVQHALTLIEEGITTHAEIIRVLGENDT
ncbi:MAG: Flp pilus assembly complex ATPase component TadA [Rhodospirillaceae bacterium]|nr:Flp pilus assembly complex ATPase component TadA [Rhodospirillaceae bacterium]